MIPADCVVRRCTGCASGQAGGNVIDLKATLPSLAALEDVPFALTARGAKLARLLEIIGVAVPDTRHHALTA